MAISALVTGGVIALFSRAFYDMQWDRVQWNQLVPNRQWKDAALLSAVWVGAMGLLQQFSIFRVLEIGVVGVSLIRLVVDCWNGEFLEHRSTHVAYGVTRL